MVNIKSFKTPIGGVRGIVSHELSISRSKFCWTKIWRHLDAYLSCSLMAGIRGILSDWSRRSRRKRKTRRTPSSMPCNKRAKSERNIIIRGVRCWVARVGGLAHTPPMHHQRHLGNFQNPQQISNNLENHRKKKHMLNRKLQDSSSPSQTITILLIYF